MRRFSLLALFPTVILAVPATAQVHSGFPVNVTVPKPPAPVVADGRTRLVYELEVTNFFAQPLELAGIDVVSGDATLATYRGDALAALLVPVGSEAEKGKPRAIDGGRTMIAFMDLSLPPGATVPARIGHRLLFTAKTGSGAIIERTVAGIDLRVQPPAPVLGAPLRGGRWVAANGLFSTDHRRSFNAVDGREHLAQRFAIDWVKLGPDGRFFKPDAKANVNYPGYGADVLAVADGTVSAVVNDLPENEGNNPREGRTVTLDTITGNSLILDLGQGRFALYAHLQPSSLKVRPGDRVKTGQVLARLGNSGNSDAPHLHFQLMDANSPLGAEGLPYALASFTQGGTLADLSGLDDGMPWAGNPAPGRPHRNEFPVDNAVVTFP